MSDNKCTRMERKIYIETYGCQMNVVDSEVIFAIMAKEGYKRTESMDEADVILPTPVLSGTMPNRGSGGA